MEQNAKPGRESIASPLREVDKELFNLYERKLVGISPNRITIVMKESYVACNCPNHFVSFRYFFN
jgi:hypothetical protein